MSNSKKTIKVKTEFSNIYGDGKNLNIGKNKSVNELLKNIPNANLNAINQNAINQNNIESKYDLERNGPLKVSLSEPVRQTFMSPLNMIFIAIIIIILLLLSLLFFYKDVVTDFFNKIFSKPSESIKAANNAAIHAAVTTSKVDSTSAKVDAATEKVDNTSAKIDNLDKKVDSLINTKSCDTKPSGPSAPSGSGVTKLNDKLNNMSPHKKSTLTEDAYCYIGYDNGQRECMEAYAGDVCMSGEIFPSLDICINPKLRP
jgi:tetrahydromethanopterin S-methyltransferase subunit B